MNIRIYYFAALAEQVGLRNEEIETSAASAAELIEELKQRGGSWSSAFDNRTRIAVNQHVVKPEQPISDGDEVALFPPVTGG